ncbi:hypothetical protein TNCV_286261 [Trichonephila clavipes]|nr:hypothetical protein TNCV_286261 [Trichonephila clavipes]
MFDQTPYKLPPPTPVQVPAGKRLLEEKSLPFFKRRITPVMRRVSRRQIPSVQIPDVLEPVQSPDVPEPVQIPHVPEPVQIPDVPEPVQIPHAPEPVQILRDPLVHIPDVPEPPVQIPPQPIPELETLTDAASLDQLMSFVFGPPAQELQLNHTVPSIFDGELISFLDEFERKLAMEPMDLTMPRLNPCVKKSIGFKVIQPRICPVNNCLSINNSPENNSHFFVRMVSVQHLLDQCRHRTTIVIGNLGVDLKFFRVGRSPSRQVWEAYQPQNTKAYTLNLTYCTRLADVPLTSSDVNGRLENASRRESTLAYGESPTLAMGFGNTFGTLASESFSAWDAV